MAKFEREVEIDSVMQKTWEVLINPTFWPEWFPGVDSVEGVAAPVVGSNVKVVIKGEAGVATFVKMQAPELLEVTTQVGKDKDQHIFKLKSTGGLLGLKADETKVEYKLDTLSGGGMIGRFFTNGNPVDAMKVNKAMIRFRKLVEKMA